MNQNERDQKLRLKEFETFIKALDLSKYGYAFEYGPVTKWIDDLSGNKDSYVWQQKGGTLKFSISIFAKFQQQQDVPDSDYLTATISQSDDDDYGDYIDLNLFEEEKNHPLKFVCYNRDNKSIEEFSKKYIETLTGALDTYLNDFIMGKRFEPTKFDRGDY